jgi:hypothetical protein
VPASSDRPAGVTPNRTSSSTAALLEMLTPCAFPERTIPDHAQKLDPACRRSTPEQETLKSWRFRPREKRFAKRRFARSFGRKRFSKKVSSASIIGFREVVLNSKLAPLRRAILTIDCVFLRTRPIRFLRKMRGAMKYHLFLGSALRDSWLRLPFVGALNCFALENNAQPPLRILAQHPLVDGTTGNWRRTLRS